MLTDFGAGWFAECIALFFGTFLQEDVAIVTGGLLVVKHHLPLTLVVISLYSGIVVSDLFIYGLGVAARRLPWAHRYLINKKVERTRKSLEGNLIPSIAIVRFLPGLLFPTFLACGWVGVSFSQFAVTTMAAGAIYTTVLLALVVNIGETVLQPIGYWGWIIMFCVVITIVVYKTMKPRWLRLSNGMSTQTIAFPYIHGHSETYLGMPSLGVLSRKVSMVERIPPFLFYIPVVIQWVMLGLRYRCTTLPTVVNPHIEAGGLWGESKSKLMRQISPAQNRWVAPFATYSRGNNGTSLGRELRDALDALSRAGLGFPVVVKPDVGWQGYGVRMLHNEKELRDYISVFPKSATIIMQQPVLHKGEAGAFYIRFPTEESGQITSLTFRYFPHLVGDGENTIRNLISQDERANFKARFYLGGDSKHLGISPEYLDTVPHAGEIVQLAFIGSLRVGGLYRNGQRYITRQLSERFDAIARSMPEFYFGRFDIRFKSIDRLQAAEDFSIIEINGAGAEAIHIWDTDTTVLEAYKELFLYQSLLFEIGNRNREIGYKPMSLKEFYTFTRQYRSLTRSYPPSR